MKIDKKVLRQYSTWGRTISAAVDMENIVRIGQKIVWRYIIETV